MTQKEINELFGPRIIGARWIEENSKDNGEAFGARMTRYSLENLRDELLRRVRSEQSYISNSAKAARKRAILRNPEQGRRRLESAA